MSESVFLQASDTPDKNIVDRTRKPGSPGSFVRSIRQNLNHTSQKANKYEIERLRIYANNLVTAKLALPLFVGIIAIVAGFWLGVQLATLWALIAGMSYVFNIVIASKFSAISNDDIELELWRRKFLYGQLLIALSWILFASYHCADCGQSSTLVPIQFSTLLMAQAATMMLAYSLGPGQLITMTPASLFMAVQLALGEDPIFLTMGAVLVSALIFFYFIAHRFNISAISDIAFKAEREGLIAELETAKSISEEARRRAEEANLAKSRFLATMSHELRTPLNAILGFSEIMKTEVFGTLDNDTYKGYVKDIHDSGNHLLTVINEILDLSRIEAGRYELREEMIFLTHVADEVIHMLKVKAEQRNITIAKEFDPEMQRIWADEKSIRQITLNLLSNALKFTPTGGNIMVRVGWTSAGGQYISVKDSGPGIPEEEIPIVLSAFGQGSIAIKSAEQGTGLGLPIVQALVHMHGGKFSLASKLREGTEALASFPAERILPSAGKIDAAKAS